ncbi:tetratricopeptide repeat protein [Laspinema palackyanum]|uniref:tetratricopeptide repeat protein n=1 Tax=Laspinema palackyanum TaxID=3231601 RepID=UPI00345D6232|nr:tetratricopeptide repeat protein [Laspinema sp. D2c]
MGGKRNRVSNRLSGETRRVLKATRFLGVAGWGTIVLGWCGGWVARGFTEPTPPNQDSWRQNDVELAVRDGKIYGRGSTPYYSPPSLSPPEPPTLKLMRYLMNEYLDVWLEILEAKKRGLSGKQIHPIFQKYQDQLDLDFAETVSQWFHSQLDSDEIEKNKDLAGILHDFAIDIQHFPLGSQVNNLEIAIVSYQAVLEFYTRPVYPEYWARTQMNLANTYYKRIKGERSENLEQAIYGYEAALEVLTLRAYPEYWATTQNNLANTYKNRIKGERAENLERAISCYRAALEVRTRSAYPEQWAMTQNNLANAYHDRIKGERAENLERAISYYRAALEVRTRSAYPEQWAMTQNNLANAYHDRIKGERAENLEQAIAGYEAALEVHTRNVYPEQWAMTQMNLAVAYKKRIRGEHAENLERAIFYYEAALEVKTRRAYPED